MDKKATTLAIQVYEVWIKHQDEELAYLVELKESLRRCDDDKHCRKARKYLAKIEKRVLKENDRLIKKHNHLINHLIEEVTK